MEGREELTDVNLLPEQRYTTELATRFRDMALAVGNLQSVLDDERRISKYVDTVNDFVREMSLVMSAYDVERLFRTPTYWTVVSGARQPAPLVAVELTALSARLTAVKEHVEHQASGWTSRQHAIVPDTSLLMECIPSIVGTDWYDLAGVDTSQSARVVILGQVLHELDGHKRLKDKKAKARSLLREIRELFRDGLSAAMPVSGQQLLPIGVVWFGDDLRHVSLPSPDNEIIDRALSLTQRLAADRVTLLTNDHTMHFTARTVSLQSRWIPNMDGED